MSTVRTCSPAFHFCIRLPSVLTPLWMPASPLRRHPPGSQAEVRGRWVSSTDPLDRPTLDLPTPFEWPIHQVGRCVSRIPDFAGQKRKRLLGLRAASSTDLVGVQPEFRQRTQAIVAWLGRPGRSQRLRRRRDSPNPAPTKASDIGPGTALDAATVLMVMVS